MSIDLSDAIRSLESSCNAIAALSSGLTAGEAVWKPSPEKWSAVEVINHLADEEVEDFRARLDTILHRPDAPFSPIDPPRAVVERGYAARDLTESVARFRRERAGTLAWLARLDDRGLDKERILPSAGVISGRTLLASWVAHDLLHLKQIARTRYELLTDQVRPSSLAYAGEWK